MRRPPVILLGALLSAISCARAEHDYPPALAAPSADRTSNLYSVTWLAHHFPTEVKPGELVRASLRFRNSSKFNWNSSVRLSYTWSLDQNEITPWHSGVRVDLGRPIAPDQEVILDRVDVKAPSIPGNYRLTFELVNELVSWFSDRGGSTLSIRVRVR